MKNLIASLGMALWLALLLSLSGCTSAINAPSPLRAARPQADLVAMGKFTDMGIVLYASETLDAYEGGALTNEILALAGAGTIVGLATGALAHPPMAQGGLIAANSVLMLLNLWRPVERSGAYNQGSGLIRESLGEYLTALILDGYCTVPANRVTPAGAVLFAETNSAIKLVTDLRQGILDLGSRSVRQLQAGRSAEPLNRREARIPEGCR